MNQCPRCGRWLFSYLSTSQPAGCRCKEYYYWIPEYDGDMKGAEDPVPGGSSMYALDASTVAERCAKLWDEDEVPSIASGDGTEELIVRVLPVEPEGAWPPKTFRVTGCWDPVYSAEEIDDGEGVPG